MSIETKIDELIQAITANTEALNNVLAAAGTTAAPAPAKSRKIEKPKEQPAAPAEPEPPTEPANVVSITTEPEQPVATEPEPTPEPTTAESLVDDTPEAPVTADDIRTFVKRVQTHFATTGKNAKDILPTVKNVRDKFAVANLNDLTEEQTGPFLAELKNLFPL